nr:hypothetical protein [Tanacetum cinerariifolium]
RVGPLPAKRRTGVEDSAPMPATRTDHRSGWPSLQRHPLPPAFDRHRSPDRPDRRDLQRREDAPAKPAKGSAIQLQNSVITGESLAVEPDVGYEAKNSTAGTKTSTPLSETPRSVSVVTRQRIQDQG